MAVATFSTTVLATRGACERRPQVTGSMSVPTTMMAPTPINVLAGQPPPVCANLAAVNAATGSGQGADKPLPSPVASCTATVPGTWIPNGSPGISSRMDTAALNVVETTKSPAAATARRSSTGHLRLLGSDPAIPASSRTPRVPLATFTASAVLCSGPETWGKVSATPAVASELRRAIRLTSSHAAGRNAERYPRTGASSRHSNVRSCRAVERSLLCR